MMKTTDIPARPEIPAPSGPIRTAWFTHGYQTAMHDIADQYATGGPEAVLEWLRNNALGERVSPTCTSGHHVRSDCTPGNCAVEHAEHFGYTD